MRYLGHLTFSIGTAALLAGCGGSQPTVAPPQMPASARITTHGTTPTASFNQVFRFHPAKDGTHPFSGLLDVNGRLYGTTARGGLSHNGTVYSISTAGVRKVIYRFRGGSDGSDPQSGLIDVNGTLYGTTTEGGSTSGCSSQFVRGCGTVFNITTSGDETVLYRFAGGSDGEYPLGDLIDVKGLLYGTTAWGGSGGVGTVYRITLAGVEKVLYAFQGSPDGYGPVGLIDVKGSLYGATTYGGAYGCTGIGCGTIYRIRTSGSEKVLYSFKGSSDGEQPQAAMIDVSGVLYGTTAYGGGGNQCFNGDHCGTIFSVTTAGVETVLYGFAGKSDGSWPGAPLTNVNGTLYGTTPFGGDHDVCCGKAWGYGEGTVFALSPQALRQRI